MNSAENQARAREFFTTMTDPDAWRQTLDQPFDDEVHWKVPAGTPAEIQQINRGKESVIPALVSIFGKVFAPGSVHYDFVLELAQDNVALFEIKLTARTHDGRQYENGYVFVFEFGPSGKVIEFREHVDTLTSKNFFKDIF